MEIKSENVNGTGGGSLPKREALVIGPEQEGERSPGGGACASEATADRLSGQVAGVLKGHKRWGKVANLPLELRDWVNAEIRDGRKYLTIVEGLSEKGFLGVTRWDLSKWRKGGHQDWLRERERVAALQCDLGRVFNALGEIDEKQTEGFERFNELLIGTQILHALQDLGRGKLASLIEGKPEVFFRIARAASDQARDRGRRKRIELAFQQYRDLVVAQKRRVMDTVEKAEGLSDEALAEIHKAMRLL